MEKLKSLLTVPYKQENYKQFTADFLNDMEAVPLQEQTDIPSMFKNTIQSYTIFGKYEDSVGKSVIVLSVKVKNNSSAPKAQRNFVAYLLENQFTDFNAALVAYFDDARKNWKLSFVTIEYEFNENGVELQFKPAKRFSFLVGEDEPTRTYFQQLNPIYESNTNPSLEQITEAFSVSRLSKDFYEEYKNKFFELYDYLSTNNVFKNEANRVGYRGEDGVKKFTTTFCKKTMGQIMFLHFIQKKGWLGVTSEWGDGDKSYLLNSTKNFVGNYFNDFLEPLFYNALNAKRDNDEYLGKKIPFLNGGLFQAIENYDWKNTDFEIPNDFWFNDKETGLLNVLSQYNFTVDEADPEEQEVAIDPEMLGKIFESLLDTNDRSSLGAFYTPREIVHFMCEESLAARLAKMLNLDYDSILNYVRYGDALKETDFIKGLAEDIDECVSEFTIVDPAVGSGAFLVGMLNQIVKLRTNLLELTNKKIDKYEIKLQTIQNSLYGVDLEYDAVEIAKLRLWLSLIVDQETNGDAPKPLPNLNFHLRVGNSLVDTFENIKLWNVRWRGSKKEAKADLQMNLFNTDTVEVILKRLKDAKVKFFNTSDEHEKQKLSRQIELEQMELIRSELVAQGKYDVFYRIEDMIKNKTKPFFIWELEFEEVYKNDGFDIVIANPPYVQLQKDGGKLANELKDQGYATFARTGDIYCIFYEKGLNLLKDKGILCYITSNKWMRAGYGEKLRGYLSANCNPLKLIDYAGNKIFESATVDVNTLIACKEKNKGKTLAVTVDDGCTRNLSDYIKQNSTEISFTNSENWVILNPIELSIKKKIEQYGTKLQDWDLSINRGILTGYNDAFIIDEATKNSLITADPKSAELIRPILRGKDIKRYTYNFANLWLIYIPWHFPLHNDPNIKGASVKAEEEFKKQYPAIYSYLEGHKEKLSKRNKAETGIRYEWYALQRWGSNYSDDFNKPKLMYSEIVQEPHFYYDDNTHFYPEATTFIMNGDNLKSLLLILNSKLTFNIFKLFYAGGGLGENGIRYKKAFLLNLRLPKLDETANSILESYYEMLLVNNFQMETCCVILNEVENYISKLYNLSQSEIDYLLN